MRGFHSQLTITTAVDEATGSEKPLFAFPVQICKATSSDDVRFDRADPNGFEVEQVYRSKHDGTIYENGDLVRGVRTGDSFAVISADEIAAIDEIVSLDDIRVVRSLPLEEARAFAFERVVGSYYLQAPPKGGAHAAYELTREALLPQPPKGKAKGRPAMALQVMFSVRTRQKVGIVYADEQRECLAMVAVEFAANVREPDEAILAPAQQVEVDPKQVAMARKVIEGLASDEIDLDTPVDEALPLKRELIAKAAAGEVIEAPATEQAETAAAGELSALLEASLA